MHIIVEIMLLLATLVYSYIEAFVMLFIPVSPKDIQGKLVLVTGGGRGIGRALALRFSQEGAKLAICDLEQSIVDAAVQEVIDNGGTAKGYVCDVTDTKAVKQMANQIRQDLGHVDILVNNAGISNGKEIMSLTDDEIKRTINVNILAHFWTIREFLPAMMSRNSGHIVTIASMAAKMGVPLLTDYCTSKHGVFGLTEALGEELKQNKKFGIKTSTVCPMFVDTPLVREHMTRMEIKNRFGNLLEASEVADAVVTGVLINKRVIYVPDHMKNMDFTRVMLPQRFQDALQKFLDIGIISKKSI